uniref:DDE-1 domain-containing protein n=1 Tax=Macrostomum lignano TaxID=282301 RepID=A0A1I8I4S3_9PLAT
VVQANLTAAAKTSSALDGRMLTYSKTFPCRQKIKQLKSVHLIDVAAPRVRKNTALFGLSVLCVRSGDWSKCSQAESPFKKVADRLTMETGLLFKQRRIFIPPRLRLEAFNTIHDTHLGAQASYNLLASSCWWPGMRLDVEQFGETVHYKPHESSSGTPATFVMTAGRNTAWVLADSRLQLASTNQLAPQNQPSDADDDDEDAVPTSNADVPPDDQQQAQLRRSLEVSTKTVRRTLDKQLITLKCLGRDADVPVVRNSPENRACRREFALWLTGVPPERHLIYVDETGFNIWTRRFQGRSRRGQRVRRVLRGVQVNVLQAVAPNLGLVHHKIVGHTLTANVFQAFVEDLLHAVNNRDDVDNADNCLVIIDRTRFHNGLRISQQFELNWQVVVLPPCPYYPFLNPTECAHSCLKQGLLKKFNEVTSVVLGLKAAIKRQIAQPQVQMDLDNPPPETTLLEWRVLVLHRIAEETTAEITLPPNMFDFFVNCFGVFSNLNSSRDPMAAVDKSFHGAFSGIDFTVFQLCQRFHAFARRLGKDRNSIDILEQAAFIRFGAFPSSSSMPTSADFPISSLTISPWPMRVATCSGVQPWRPELLTHAPRSTSIRATSRRPAFAGFSVNFSIVVQKQLHNLDEAPVSGKVKWHPAPSAVVQPVNYFRVAIISGQVKCAAAQLVASIKIESLLLQHAHDFFAIIVACNALRVDVGFALDEAFNQPDSVVPGGGVKQSIANAVLSKAGSTSLASSPLPAFWLLRFRGGRQNDAVDNRQGFPSRRRSRNQRRFSMSLSSAKICSMDLLKEASGHRGADAAQLPECLIVTARAMGCQDTLTFNSPPPGKRMTEDGTTLFFAAEADARPVSSSSVLSMQSWRMSQRLALSMQIPCRLHWNWLLEHTVELEPIGAVSAVIRPVAFLLRFVALELVTAEQLSRWAARQDGAWYEVPLISSEPSEQSRKCSPLPPSQRDSLGTHSPLLHENLRESYRCLSAELQRVSRASSAKLVSHVSDQLVEFVQARLDLMDVYAALASQSLAPNQQQQSQAAQQAPHQLQLKSRDFVIRDVECLMQRYRGKFHHPKLAGISTCFEDETEILFHLLNASGRINNLYFLESMLSLHEVSNRLVVWQDQAAKYPPALRKNPQKLHKAGQPNLLHWFHRLYSHLLSKYTLCFCSVLAQQSPSGQQQEMVRMAQQRQDPEDLLMKLIQLHKRTDCVASLLIFNATAQSEPYLGHGYYLPGLMGERPVGKDGYPVIFAFPPAESAPPASAAAAGAAASSSAVGPAAGPGDMTNILMTVASENWGSGGPSAGEVRVRFFSDDKLRRSYCIGYAEPRLHLALVLEHRGTQRSGSSQKDRALERQGFPMPKTTNLLINNNNNKYAVRWKKAASQGPLQSLGANKGRTAGRVRGASVGQQAVDETPSSGLAAPQHLLHRLRAVGLGADDVACQLESPKSQQFTWTGQAGAAIECRVSDPLVADLKGGAQQASVRRVDLLFERIRQRPGLGVVQQDGLDHRLEQRRPLAVRAKGSPSEPAATPQIFADRGSSVTCPPAPRQENCGLDVARHAEHNGLLRVDHQADARCSANQLVQLALGALYGRGQQGEVIGVAKHAEPFLRRKPSSSVGRAVRSTQSSTRTNRNGARVSPWSTPEDVSKESDRPSGVITAAHVAVLVHDTHGAHDCRQMPRCSSSRVVPGFFGMAMMCAMVHSVGAISPESTRFITRATSLATQWMRSASMGTSSGPSALPPGVFWASITTSAMVTGATLKLSSDGNGVSGGSVRMLGSGGGGALTMAAKNSRSSFLRSSAVSPARFSWMRRFRPSINGGPGHAPSGVGSSGRDGLDNFINCGLLPLQIDSRQSLLRLASRSPAQTEPLQIFPRLLNRGVVLPDRLPTLGRSHQRDRLFRGGSYCGAHIRGLGT